MQHSPNVHKKVVNNFYGEIRNFYKCEAPVTFNGPAYFGEGGTAEQTAPTTEAERHLTDEQIIAGVLRCQQ